MGNGLLIYLHDGSTPSGKVITRCITPDPVTSCNCRAAGTVDAGPLPSASCTDLVDRVVVSVATSLSANEGHRNL